MPVEIREKEFTRVLRGYDPKEVKETLEEIAEDFGHLLDENRKLSEQLAAYEKLETNLKNTLMFAQKTSEETKKNADKERDNIIKAAEEEAKKIIDEANKALSKAKSDAKALEKEIREQEKKIFDGIDERKIEVERELGQLETKKNAFRAHFKSLLSSYLEELSREETLSGETKKKSTSEKDE